MIEYIVSAFLSSKFSIFYSGEKLISREKNQVQHRHSIKVGLDLGLDSGPWTLDSGLQIKFEKETRKKKINRQVSHARQDLMQRIRWSTVTV